jgi:hypothetical protein
MLGRLSNQALMALFCIGMIVASLVVIGGTFYAADAFWTTAPRPLFNQVVWKP